MVKDRAAGVIVGPGGKIVLTFRRDHMVWSIPGGGVEENEKPLQALERELGEELGLKSLVFVKKLGFYVKHSKRFNGQRKTHVFLFRSATRKFRPKDVDEPRWFSFKQAVQNVDGAPVKQFLTRHEKNIGFKS